MRDDAEERAGRVAHRLERPGDLGHGAQLAVRGPVARRVERDDREPAAKKGLHERRGETAAAPPPAVDEGHRRAATPGPRSHAAAVDADAERPARLQQRARVRRERRSRGSEEEPLREGGTQRGRRALEGAHGEPGGADLHVHGCL